MFGIGLTEMIIIGIVALIFIGPDQLPEVARTVARFLNDLRRNTDEIKHQFREASRINPVDPQNGNDTTDMSLAQPHGDHPPALEDRNSLEPEISSGEGAQEPGLKEGSASEGDLNKAKSSNES